MLAALALRNAYIGGMKTLREQAREAVAAKSRTLIGGLHEALADAASDVWEPIAVALRDHVPERQGDYYFCICCSKAWPCAERKQAIEALGS